MFPMMWNNALGTRPGLSRTTLRYFRRLLNLPSSTQSSSGLPTVTSSKPYRCIQGDGILKKSSLQILGAVADYWKAHRIPPSVRDIKEATNASSTSVVAYRLAKLTDAGCMTKVSNIARGIMLTELGTTRVGGTRCVGCGSLELVLASPPVCADCRGKASASETLKRLPVLPADPSYAEALQITKDAFAECPSAPSPFVSHCYCTGVEGPGEEREVQCCHCGQITTRGEECT